MLWEIMPPIRQSYCRLSIAPSQFLITNSKSPIPNPSLFLPKLTPVMDTGTISLIVATAAMLASFYAVYIANEKRRAPQKAETSNETRPLQLQAYERLVMLTERLALPNLISRNNQPDLSAKEMQYLLLSSIKQEFEYNATQQIYVSPVAWQAVKNLKEQNMMIINQVGQTLPADAKGIDLNKRIMEIMIAQDKNALHNIVLEALNFEARKLMK